MSSVVDQVVAVVEAVDAGGHHPHCVLWNDGGPGCNCRRDAFEMARSTIPPDYLAQLRTMERKVKALDWWEERLKRPGTACSRQDWNNEVHLTWWDEYWRHAEGDSLLTAVEQAKEPTDD